jgi:hypothetical protein
MTKSSRRPGAVATETSAEIPTAPAKTKIASVVALLRRPEGASLEVMMCATGWQAHSVRGALAGSIKKGLGLPVISEKVDGARVYRIAPEVSV